MGRDPYDNPAFCIAPHVWFHAERTILMARGGHLGDVAYSLRELHDLLSDFRKRDAFFLEAWRDAGGPMLLKIPEERVQIFPYNLGHLRDVRRVLFALLERMGSPFRLGYRWPVEPGAEPVWEPDAGLRREAAA